MRTIWKYPVPMSDVFAHSMPAGAEILSVQVQLDQPQIWALVDPGSSEHATRSFRLAGTGHELHEDNLCHIGSFQLQDGAFVGHLFELVL